MAIIISKNGANARRVEMTPFSKEGYLQEYIHDNPESIPIYDIEEDKRLFVFAREHSTESGPIDALAIDKDGDIYIVETKLYKNPDKRYVVAQALDYGASLWKHSNDFSEFINQVDQEVKNKFNIGFKEKTKAFFYLEDEQVELLINSMKRNLFDGNLKFVILMDSMDERLKDLIIYINQNSQFDIYAVELEYYKYEEYEIMIPKIFGVEVKKNVKTSSDSSRKTWSKDDFINDARNKIKDDEVFNIISELYDFIEKNADKLSFGSGAESGSVTFKFEDSRARSGYVSIFTVWSGGTIVFRFANIKDRIGDKYVNLYYQKLKNALPSKKWNENVLKGYGLRFFVKELFSDKNAMKSFKNTVMEYVKEIKSEK
jgi:hypothetical protein